MPEETSKKEKLNLPSGGRLGRTFRYSIPHIFVLILVVFYYRLEWKDLSGFITSIDRGSQFMQDFASYYHPMSRQILQDPNPITGYYYTSFFALILSPIGNLPDDSAMVFWGVIQFVFLIVLFLASLRYLPDLPPLNSSLYLFLFATSFPILNNIKWGQVSILITACVLIASILLYKNKPVISGVLLAFVAAIKFYPSIFAILFLIKREFRAVAAFCISIFVFYFAFPASILGFQNWLEFESLAGSEITGAGWVARDVNSQYFTHVVLRWLEILFNKNGGSMIEVALTISGTTLAFSCILAAWLLGRQTSKEMIALSFAAIFISIPFVLKTSWPHYFVYLPFCQGALLSYSYYAAKDDNPVLGKVPAIFALLSILLSNIFFFNLFPDWSLYNTYGMLFLSNLFLLFGIYTILFSGIKITKFVHGVL